MGYDDRQIEITKAAWQVIVRDHLIQAHQNRYDLIKQVRKKELVKLQAANLIRANLDLNLEANALITLVDGIATRVVISLYQCSVEQQKYLDLKDYILVRKSGITYLPFLYFLTLS
ncbi:MAG: TetR family transcriptional regulator C-terminal domain-containing protein [Leptolyngbyaceae cyanobacterium MAG.088]|nr:TetR family transcriptional regulator C-terminal domain-containing protein [Leptolyngbyaceae cyanobacterium MAG.088]